MQEYVKNGSLLNRKIILSSKTSTQISTTTDNNSKIEIQAEGKKFSIQNKF